MERLKTAQLKKEKAELKENRAQKLERNMAQKREEVHTIIFTTFRDCILDFKRKGGDDPNSQFHDKIREVITRLEENSTKYGLDEEDVLKLKDLVTSDRC